jgi:hypothetical protein
MVVVNILKPKSGRGWYSFVTIQNSDYVSDCKTEEPGFDFWRGTGIFLLVTVWWHVLGHNQPPTPRVRGWRGRVFLEGKAAEARSLLLVSIKCRKLWPNGFITSGLIMICSLISQSKYRTPIPASAWSKEWVFDLSLAGIVGSNTARGMDMRLSWLFCVVR